MNNVDTTYRFRSDDGSTWLDPIWFEEGQTKEFGLLFDWREEKAVKDWSLTAWGELTKPKVRHENYPAEKTQHFPQYTDDKTNVSPPQPIKEPSPTEVKYNEDPNAIPEPPKIHLPPGDDRGSKPPPEPIDLYPGCYDTDTVTGARDFPYHDGCNSYRGNEHWCERYDHEGTGKTDGKPRFNSKEMCCACGGGSTEVQPEAAPDDGQTGMGQCRDLDNKGQITDQQWDNCGDYKGYSSWCGKYDDEDFKAAELCCICGGGEYQTDTTPTVTTTTDPVVEETPAGDQTNSGVC